MVRSLILPAVLASIASSSAELGSADDERLLATIVDRRFECPFREIEVATWAAGRIQCCCRAAYERENCDERGVINGGLHLVCQIQLGRRFSRAVYNQGTFD